MQKKKIFLLLAIVLNCLLPFTSHSKIQKKTKNWINQVEQPKQLQKNYQLIVKYYLHKKYGKAASLIEELLPSFSGKKELPMIQLYQAYCSYYNGDYLVSAEQFKSFYKRYPKHEKIEEAMFMHGYVLYCIMPDIKLDQHDTLNAIAVLQKYLNNFSMGQYRICVLEYLTELNNNLMQKDFASSAFYYDSGKYHAALISLQNFQQEYPHSSLEELVFYLKAKIQYHLSREKKEKDEKKEALQRAITFCNDFLLYYPNSKKVRDIQKLLINLSKNNLDYTLKLEKLN